MDVIACLLIMLLVVPYLLNFDVPYLNTDEFGYWGSASFFAGYDWSSIIATNSYFSYGYGFILALLLICIKNSVICFKATIILNAFFLMGLYLILKRIFSCLVDGINYGYRCSFCLIATLYCAMVTYAGMSLPECLLAFLFALNIYLLLLFFQKPSWGKGVGILVLSLYMYTVHQRTIVFFAMNILFVVGYLLKNSKGEMKKAIIKILSLLVIFCLLYVGTSMLKTLVQSNVWLISASDGEVIVGNDFSGQIGKIKFLFSIEGITEFIYSFCGRIFYFITSTYGLIILFFVNAVRSLLDKDEAAVVKFFNLYLLLSITGAIVVSCVFLIKPTNTTYLFYGRYCDNIAPVIVLATCLSLKKVSKEIVAAGILVINLLGIILNNRILNVALTFQNTSISHVAMSTYYVNEELNVLAVGLFIALTLSAGIVFIKKGRKIGAAVFGAIYLLSSIRVGYQAVDIFYIDDILYNIEQIVEIAYDIKDRDIEELNVLVTDGETPGKYDKYGKIIQFINPELVIHLSAEMPEKGEYYVAHIGKGPEYSQITVLMENGGYILGICE